MNKIPESNPLPQENNSLPIERTNNQGKEIKNKAELENKMMMDQAPSIIMKSRSDVASNVINKNIEHKRNFFEKTSHFFSRLFSKIPDTKLKAANDISTNIQILEKKLENAGEVLQKIDMTQRAISKMKPQQLVEKNLIPGHEKSLDYSKNAYLEVMLAYSEAAKFLYELEEQKDLAGKLSHDHMKFNKLPEQIEKLEKRVAFLKANVEIHAQFQNIEAALKDMPDILKMEDISKVMESGKDLANTLKNLLLNNPGLKDSEKVKKFLDEIPLNKNWTGGDIYKCIALNFPSLKNQMGRLMNANSVIQNKFISQIEEKTDESIPFLELHSKLSKEIKECKQTMEGKTFGAKFARLFYGVLGKDYLNKKLHKLQEDQGVIYSHIQKLGKDLMNKEMDPLIAFKKPELGQYIEAFRKITVAFEAEHKINDLINKLKVENNGNKEILENGVKNIAQILEKNFGGVIRIKKENLPKDFDKKTPKDQFRLLISYSFPKIRENNDELFNLIKEKGLEAKVTEILISRIPKQEPEINENQSIKVEEEVLEILPKDVQESEPPPPPSNLEIAPPPINLEIAPPPINLEIPPPPINLEIPPPPINLEIAPPPINLEIPPPPPNILSTFPKNIPPPLTPPLEDKFEDVYIPPTNTQMDESPPPPPPINVSSQIPPPPTPPSTTTPTKPTTSKLTLEEELKLKQKKGLKPVEKTENKNLTTEEEEGGLAALLKKGLENRRGSLEDENDFPDNDSEW